MSTRKQGGKKTEAERELTKIAARLDGTEAVIFWLLKSHHETLAKAEELRGAAVKAVKMRKDKTRTVADFMDATNQLERLVKKLKPFGLPPAIVKAMEALKQDAEKS